ncbi:MAG: FkbM family methyltransferase [Phycisphaerales bacterium]|nr:FkbM family methyltransferase [Phycisphaerales bacterium]
MIQTLRLIQRAHRYKRRHDPAEIAEMRRLIPSGGTAIDIGAHKGAYTYWMSKGVGPKGHVVAIEPQQELAARLKELYQANTRVRIRHSAVSTHTGTITLHIPGEGPSHGASIRELEADADGPVRAVEVPSIALNDIAGEYALKRIDFIKCDTEGAERDIFRAGSNTLEKYRPGVLVECEKRHADDDSDPVGELWEIFRSLGYEGRCFHAGRLIGMDEFDYAKHQRDPNDKPNYANNFLFTHPKRTATLLG